jgi:hypothetical protein
MKHSKDLSADQIQACTTQIFLIFTVYIAYAKVVTTQTQKGPKMHGTLQRLAS